MAAPVVLDEETVRFMAGGVSMHAAARDAALVPTLTRPLACRVSQNRRRVTILVLASLSGELLADVRANGQLALVVTMPSTHRTIQLKGSDAAQEAMRDGDHDLIARQREAFVQDVSRLGFEAALPKMLLEGARDDVVAIGFTIDAAFTQTPGPGAGAPLQP